MLVVTVGVAVFVCRARKADQSGEIFEPTTSKRTPGSDSSNALGVTMESLAPTPSAKISEGPNSVQKGAIYHDVSDVRFDGTR